MAKRASRLSPLREEIWKWKSHHAILVGTVEGVTIHAPLDLRVRFPSDLFGDSCSCSSVGPEERFLPAAADDRCASTAIAADCAADRLE